MILTGRKKIEGFVGLSWNTIIKLHYQDGLPLARLGYKWALDVGLFREWLFRRSQPHNEFRKSSVLFST